MDKPRAKKFFQRGTKNFLNYECASTVWAMEPEGSTVGKCDLLAKVSVSTAVGAARRPYRLPSILEVHAKPRQGVGTPRRRRPQREFDVEIKQFRKVRDGEV